MYIITQQYINVQMRLLCGVNWLELLILIISATNQTEKSPGC